MPTEYKRKSNNRELWINERLSDVVEAVQSGKLSVNPASRVFGIPTLEDDLFRKSMSILLIFCL